MKMKIVTVSDYRWRPPHLPGMDRRNLDTKMFFILKHDSFTFCPGWTLCELI